MPIIRVEMLPGRSQETKAQLAAELTASAARCLGARPEHIYVIFSEVSGNDWAVGGGFLTAHAPAATDPHKGGEQ